MGAEWACMCVSPNQAHEAVDAARASLGRYEAALAARAAKLADSWRLMREAADRLLSGDRLAPDPGLEVLTWRVGILERCMHAPCMPRWLQMGRDQVKGAGMKCMGLMATRLPMSGHTYPWKDACIMLSRFSFLYQEDAAAAERNGGLWGLPDAAAAPALEAPDLDWGSAAPAELAAALGARLAAAAERESALQRWAVSLEIEAARQASERRGLAARAEEVTGAPFGC